jgi:hypothetical protein
MAVSDAIALLARVTGDDDAALIHLRLRHRRNRSK